MKQLSLLVWITQLGMSVVMPLAGFTLLGVWLYWKYAWGEWVIFAGIVLGLVSAISGLRVSLKTMQRLAEGKKEPPAVSYNQHD